MSVSKKQVILVDHNEKSQAVDGLAEAEILEIIDHHRLGSIETMGPVYFRNQPVGCTATIVYQMYQENQVEITPQIAGLLCSAIISDTLLFRSPTCTAVDIATAEKLAESIKLINNKRKALARLYECRKNENVPISGTDALVISQIAFYDDPARFAQMTNKLCDELEKRIADGISVVPAGTKRIMLTGTPLAIPNWKLHNIVETSGAVVVCEEMCTGTRYFERYVDETKETVEEQIGALAERYMGINCACFTPNHARIDDIVRLAKEYKVDGIVDVNLKFCNLYDTEGYFVERALKEEGIPVLGIETDYTDSDAQQLRTRVSAFIEMLNN